MWFPVRSGAGGGYETADAPVVETCLSERNRQSGSGEILFFDFDYDASRLLVGLASGFQIWDLEPLRFLHEEELGAGVGIVSQLLRSNIFALVGDGEHPVGPRDTVILYDLQTKRRLAEIPFESKVQSVRFAGSRIIVTVEDAIHVLDVANLEPVKLLHIEKRQEEGPVARAIAHFTAQKKDDLALARGCKVRVTGVEGMIGKGELVWSIEFHHLFPERFKDIVRTAMLMRSRPDCVWSSLPLEILFHIVHWVADGFPGTAGTFPICCVRQPSKGLVATHHCGPSLSDIVIACPGLYPGQVQLSWGDQIACANASTVIEAHKHRVRCLALSVDGGKLATASSSDPFIRVYDTSLKREITKLMRRETICSDVYHLAFSKDSACLCCTDDDGIVELFDVVGSAVMNEVKASYMQIRTGCVLPLCAFGATNSVVIVISADGLIRIYHVHPSSVDVASVEDILERRICDARLEYLVKWRGRDEASWEPYARLWDVLDLVMLFEKRFS